ncbi:hypothetical protein FQZ97_948680 [compost metagenome]
MAEPFRPFRKSLVPSLGSITQHHECPVRTCPVSSPQKSQGNSCSNALRSCCSISTSTGALSPKPRGPSARRHSADNSLPACST